MGIDKDEIKRRVSIEQVLNYYGRQPNEKGLFQCLDPENHNNGDQHFSGRVSGERVYCMSQQCFGEKGMDIFSLVGRMGNLQKFPEQKAWLEATFGLTNGKPQKNKIIRAFEWTDAQGRVAYHLRLDEQ